VNHNRVGADLGAVADLDRPEQRRAGADHHLVAHGRVALAARETGAAQRDSLVDRHVIPHLGGLADHHPSPVIDEQPTPNPSGGMNLDPRHRGR
jgi:hypothetical protein